MVRLLCLAGLAASVVQAQRLQQQQSNASVIFDTNPETIDNLGSTVAVTPTVLDPNSPLLNTTDTTALQKRQSINVVIAGVAAGGTVIIAGNAAVDLYDNIAAKIKAKSDHNSCTLIYGTDHDDGYYEGYAYQATTTGKNCDTTAIQKTINNAVRNCATKLNKARAVTGCCNFRHGGGSWHGHLRLSADPDRYPVRSAQCP
jgi:hypothetical protein